MGVPGYRLNHIRWAIAVEESGLCTPDFLDQHASADGKHYIKDEGFQEDVERARHFIFDELPTLGGTEFHEKLIYHLRNFTQDDVTLHTLVNDILAIVTNH